MKSFVFFCNFAYGFYKNEIIDFSIVCVCYMKLFSACFCICAYETSDFLNLFYVFRMKELMFIYICFSYETHDSLISLCLCICNHRFVFFYLKTIDVRICCACCPCETIDFVFFKFVVFVYLKNRFLDVFVIFLFEPSVFQFVVCFFLRDIIVFLFVVRFFLWDQRFFVASCIFHVFFKTWKPAISNCFERKFFFHETIDFLNCLYFFKMRPLHSLLCVACVCPKWNHMFKHKLSLCVLNRKPSVFSFFGADIRKPSIFYFCVWFSNESIDFSLLLYGS